MAPQNQGVVLAVLAAGAAFVILQKDKLFGDGGDGGIAPPEPLPGDGGGFDLPGLIPDLPPITIPDLPTFGGDFKLQAGYILISGTPGEEAPKIPGTEIPIPDFPTFGGDFKLQAGYVNLTPEAPLAPVTEISFPHELHAGYVIVSEIQPLDRLEAGYVVVSVADAPLPGAIEVIKLHAGYVLIGGPIIEEPPFFGPVEPPAEGQVPGIPIRVLHAGYVVVSIRTPDIVAPTPPPPSDTTQPPPNTTAETQVGALNAGYVRR